MKSTSTLDKQTDGSIKLTITLPQEEVKQVREKILKDKAQNAKVAGFRKGKAPQKLVEERLDEQTINEEILRQILPTSYSKAISEHNLKPIINPKIHIAKLEKDKDWAYEAVTCEAPAVDLGDYKKKVQAVTAKSKIVVPGKEQKEPSFDEIMQTMLEAVSIQIPPVLVEQEVNRLLSQTLEEIKKLGLTLDQYLSSTNKTADDLRAEYTKKAESDIKTEFALQKIAEEEKLTVSDKDIEEALNKAQSEQEKQNLQANRYLLASILRQQKTLDFLKSL